MNVNTLIILIVLVAKSISSLPQMTSNGITIAGSIRGIDGTIDGVPVDPLETPVNTLIQGTSLVSPNDPVTEVPAPAIVEQDVAENEGFSMPMTQTMSLGFATILSDNIPEETSEGGLNYAIPFENKLTKGFIDRIGNSNGNGDTIPITKPTLTIGQATDVVEKDEPIDETILKELLDALKPKVRKLALNGVGNTLRPMRTEFIRSQIAQFKTIVQSLASLVPEFQFRARSRDSGNYNIETASMLTDLSRGSRRAIGNVIRTYPMRGVFTKVKAVLDDFATNIDILFRMREIDSVLSRKTLAPSCIYGADRAVTLLSDTSNKVDLILKDVDDNIGIELQKLATEGTNLFDKIDSDILSCQETDIENRRCIVESIKSNRDQVVIAFESWPRRIVEIYETEYERFRTEVLFLVQNFAAENSDALDFLLKC